MGGGLQQPRLSVRSLFQDRSLIDTSRPLDGPTAGAASAAGSALQGGDVVGAGVNAARAVKGMLHEGAQADASGPDEEAGPRGARGSLETSRIDCKGFQKASTSTTRGDAAGDEEAAGGDDGSVTGGRDNNRLRKALQRMYRHRHRDGAAAFEESTSGSSTDRTSMDGAPSHSGHYQPGRDVVVRLEYLTAGQTKAAYLFLYSTTVLAAGFLLGSFINKLRDKDRLRPDVLRINVALGAICLTALLAALAHGTWHYLRIYREGKLWKRRRLYGTLLVAAELVAQTLNSICFLVNNAVILGQHCNWASHLLPYMALVQWSCWNTIWLLFTIWAHNASPLKLPLSPELAKQQVEAHGPGALFAPNKALIDQPFLPTHGPKFLLWVAMEALIIANSLVYATGSGLEPEVRASLERGDWTRSGCRETDAAICSISPTQIALASCMVGCFYIYFLLIIAYTWRALHRLKHLPRQDYRIANMLLRLQLRTRVNVILFFALSLALLWWVNMQHCASYAYTWPGMLPVQIAETGIVLTWQFLLGPRTVTTEPLRVWLQEFAWTEAEKPLKLEVRNSLVAGAGCGLEHEAMFCFESALNLLAWTTLAYDFREVPNPTISLETAMQLYRLTDAELIWERKSDTKILLAWSERTLVVAFRGTASLANALADLQAWRCVHPPKRGASFWHRPRVHRGFYNAWTTNGLKERVMQRIKEIHISRAQATDTNSVCLPPMKIYLTGHSLGGAMAQIMAYDLALLMKKKPYKPRLCVYTFGAPRVGNHSFARDYDTLVPDTFHVVNDQDAVARAPKFLILYKKAGHRVIINTHGDMLVRPSYVEASMELVPGAGRVSQHLLGDYLRSLLAVMLAQFSRKRFSNGMEGVLRLAERSRPVQKLLLERAGLSLSDIRGMVAQGPTHLPRIRPTKPKPKCKQDEARAPGMGALDQARQAGKRALVALRLAACLSTKGAGEDGAASVVAGGRDLTLGLDDEEGMTVDMRQQPPGGPPGVKSPEGSLKGGPALTESSSMEDGLGSGHGKDGGGAAPPGKLTREGRGSRRAKVLESEVIDPKELGWQNSEAAV